MHSILLPLTPLALACAACVVPWLFTHAPEIGFALQRGFALVCHQQPERSFFLFGGRVAVCARCLGIYLGTALGLLVHVKRRIATALLIAAVTMSASDWLAEVAGLHGNWSVARFTLGIALGAAAVSVVASAEVLTEADAR
jgi:uncharacterized membrane protein